MSQIHGLKHEFGIKRVPKWVVPSLLTLDEFH